MCYKFTSYQFEETSRAFIKTNLDFADQGKRRSQRLDSRSPPKNQFRKLVSRSDSKVLSFENKLVRKVIATTSGKNSTRRITRHASLDYNINKKLDTVNDVIVISVICVFVRIFVNICKILNVSCFCLYRVIKNLLCVMYKSLHNLFYCKNYVVSNVVSSQILCFLIYVIIKPSIEF